MAFLAPVIFFAFLSAGTITSLDHQERQQRVEVSELQSGR